MLECLAIKPDLVFLWDEAWFGFARFSPLLRMRTAMGGAGKLRAMFRDPAYRDRYAQWQESMRDIGETDARRIEMPLLPDPRPGRGARLPDRVRAQVDVGAAPGLDHRRGRPAVPPRGGAVQGGVLHAYLHQSPNLQIIASTRPRPAADGAGGLRAGAARPAAGHRDPARDQQPSADLALLPRRRRRPR